MKNIIIKDNEIDATTIANYYLTKKELTPKKIQKLVYYAYAWFIALSNDEVDNIYSVLFKEEPEAWIHGPVFKSIYDKYKSYAWNEVPKNEDEIHFENDEVQSLLDNVWNVYKDYSADELEYMTHHELPWINARKGKSAIEASNEKINKKDIFTYYNSLNEE